MSDVLSFKRKKSHSENTVTKAEIDDEISTSDKYVLVAQKDLNGKAMFIIIYDYIAYLFFFIFRD